MVGRRKCGKLRERERERERDKNTKERYRKGDKLTKEIPTKKWPGLRCPPCRAMPFRLWHGGYRTSSSHATRGRDGARNLFTFRKAQCNWWAPILFSSGTMKRVFLEGGFCKHVCLSWLWRSECHMYCRAQHPWVVFVSFGVTLDPAKILFANPPFLGSCSLRSCRSSSVILLVFSAGNFVGNLAGILWDFLSSTK